jgi:hypothetical protein
MNFLKKVQTELFDKDAWISSCIVGICWTIFVFAGGYVAFFTSIHPVWLKA